jgi:hypothetical protein
MRAIAVVLAALLVVGMLPARGDDDLARKLHAIADEVIE